MNEAIAESTDRLDRLERYLEVDPSNTHLLADAFETALGAERWDRAEFHMRHGLALGVEPLAWQLREAHWLMAQRRWAQSRSLLEEMARQPRAAEGPVAAAQAIGRDLAHVCLMLGDPGAGLAGVEPFVEGLASADVDETLAVLWIRLLHHAGAHERALPWIEKRERERGLESSVAGVASLLALDAGRYDASLRWAEMSLAAASPPAEAYVAKGSLALARRDAAAGKALFEQAIALKPDDGRTRSGLGFAALLDGKWAIARGHFDAAIQVMPDHIGTWHGLAWSAIAQHDLDAARQAFETALRLDRNFAESHGGAAVVSVLEGDTAAARESIDRALGLDRACLSARYADALLAGDARDTRSVFRLAERLLAGRQGPLGGNLIDLLSGQ